MAASDTQSTSDETTPLVRSDESRYIPKDQIEYEFGGPIGALGMMIGFPLLMWYMWISAQFYNGQFAFGRSILERFHY